MEMKKLLRVLPHPGRDESRAYAHPYSARSASNDGARDRREH